MPVPRLKPSPACKGVFPFAPAIAQRKKRGLNAIAPKLSTGFSMVGVSVAVLAKLEVPPPSLAYPGARSVVGLDRKAFLSIRKRNGVTV
jgi:hypothetical protein